MSQEIGAQGNTVPNFIKTQFTVDEGLPSNECHRILQDSFGYIWIATDRGLVRYDGYEFRTFGPNEGLGHSSVIDIVLSGELLYVLTFSSIVYTINVKTLRIGRYTQQDLLDSIRIGPKYHNLAVSYDGEICFEGGGVGLVCIKDSARIYFNELHDYSAYHVLEHQSKLSLFSVSRYPDLQTPLRKRCSRSKDEFCLVVDDRLYEFSSGIRRTDAHTNAFLLDSSRVVVSMRGCNYFIDSDGFISQNVYDAPLSSVEPYGQGFLCGRLDQEGLKWFPGWDELLKDEGSMLIDNSSVTDVMYSSEGYIWITTLLDGIYRLELPEISSYISRDVGGSAITAIETLDDDMYVVLDRRRLMRIGPRESKIIYETDKAEIRDLDIGPDGELVVTGHKILTIDSIGSINYFRSTLGRAGFVGAKKCRIYNGRAFFLNKQNLLISDDYRQVCTSELYKPLHNSDTILYDFIVWSDSLNFIASQTGFFQISEGYLEVPLSLEAYKGLRVNCLEAYMDALLLGTQGQGVIVWRPDSIISILGKEQGLSTANIEALHVYDDQVYICSKAGLNQVAISPDWDVEVINYGIEHGLPSNDVSDIAVVNDTVYIATSKGLALQNLDYRRTDTSRVLIESWSVDSTASTDMQRVSYDKNSISIGYRTIDYSQAGDVEYRYRVNAGKWTVSTATTADFIDLPPGKYSFQVQAKNRDGIWGPSTELNWRILQPIWNRWYAWLIYLVVVGALLYWIYQRRIRQLKERSYIEEEIRNLEKSALQAQMSPHFIFNSLNSIQSFITSNQKEEAMSYLTSFAQLIRAYLKASVENEISLDEEIRLLENYLSLEQLRLDGRFEYSFAVDSSLDLYNTMMPSMLIQPFVENAVVHGMKGVMENGRIEVRVQKLGNDLAVQVEDNGRYDENSRKDHVSYGSSITQKRLRHLHNEESEMEINTQITESGTTVSFLIPMSS